MTDKTERDAAIERAKAYEAEHFANPSDSRFSSDVLADFALAETASLREEVERLRAALEQDETLIVSALLEADLQERLDCVRDIWGEAVRDAKTPHEADMLGANSDGQIGVLERLLSDIRAGLWTKGIKEKV